MFMSEGGCEFMVSYVMYIYNVVVMFSVLDGLICGEYLWFLIREFSVDGMAMSTIGVNRDKYRYQ